MAISKDEAYEKLWRSEPDERFYQGRDAYASSRAPWNAAVEQLLQLDKSEFTDWEEIAEILMKLVPANPIVYIPDGFTRLARVEKRNNCSISLSFQGKSGEEYAFEVKPVTLCFYDPGEALWNCYLILSLKAAPKDWAIDEKPAEPWVMITSGTDVYTRWGLFRSQAIHEMGLEGAKFIFDLMVSKATSSAPPDYPAE